jgi:hypothetical protein
MPHSQFSELQLPLQQSEFEKQGPTGTQQPPSRQVCWIPVHSLLAAQRGTGVVQKPLWARPVQQSEAALVGAAPGMQQTPASQTDPEQQSSELQAAPAAAHATVLEPPLLPPRVDELWRVVVVPPLELAAPLEPPELLAEVLEVVDRELLELPVELCPELLQDAPSSPVAQSPVPRPKSSAARRMAVPGDMAARGKHETTPLSRSAEVAESLDNGCEIQALSDGRQGRKPNHSSRISRGGMWTRTVCDLLDQLGGMVGLDDGAILMRRAK